MVALEESGCAMETSTLVPVGTFDSVAVAEIAKGILDDTHIESMIRTGAERITNATVSELLVRPGDAPQAREALDEYETSLACFAPPGVARE